MTDPRIQAIQNAIDFEVLIENLKGDQGEQGERGLRGVRGLKGETGERGERGLRGERGNKGEKEERGQQGKRGEKGEPGENNQLLEEFRVFREAVTTGINQTNQILKSLIVLLQNRHHNLKGCVSETIETAAPPSAPHINV